MSQSPSAKARRPLAALFCALALTTSILSLSPYSATTAAAADLPFPEPYNSQEFTEGPMAPAEVAKTMKLPEGFHTTVFASEPNAQQPIAMAMDARGRLWVAENYTYSELKLNFDLRLRDRIIILEDTDGDGVFDKRTVFWDQAQRLTSIEIGFGGVWALCPPQLLFIPDRNGDDKPDGPPEPVLDGWNDNAVRHNIANGLKWGPDGWLYGRHGILATSIVGRPGAPEKERVKLNCGIWRYHPTRKSFEVVCVGTTNPWGMDFDEFGEAFFINTVIGHLWHVIPGAHYKRMYGDDLQPYVYETIDQHADHYHWNTQKHWTDSRSGAVEHDQLGGGHAHSGLMIYQGDNWPDKYRGGIFSLNFHGRRINFDSPIRNGTGYIGRHNPDPILFPDKWFRGIDLLSGPDGAVYVADWSDTGECHEQEGVHRTSGRIYRIAYGDVAARNAPSSDPRRMADSELVDQLRQSNVLRARQAALVLQERASSGADLTALRPALQALALSNENPVHAVRALWALHRIGLDDGKLLRRVLKHPNEHLRAWAVRFLAESESASPDIARAFAALAAKDPSGLVRLHLASALQRMPLENRPPLAAALLAHAEDQTDHNQPLMLWYGIEPLANSTPETLVKLAIKGAIPAVVKLSTRRLAEGLERDGAPLNAMLAACLKEGNTRGGSALTNVVDGLYEALQGWRKAQKPSNWDAFSKALALSPEPTRAKARQLAVVFGDGRALDELRQLVGTEAADAAARRSALQALIDGRVPELKAWLPKLLTNEVLRVTAARGLTLFDDPDSAYHIVAYLPWFRPADKPEVMSALVARPTFARVLLEAIAKGTVPRSDLSPFHARQIRSFGDNALTEKLRQVWGDVRETDQDKAKSIKAWKEKLTPETLHTADLVKGKALFAQICAQCHRLHGEGASIGPDLTGSNRDNLDYLLENMLDPNAIVPADYKMSIATLKDGRILNGLVAARSERTITLQTMTERVVIERNQIEDLSESALSLMPEGLLDPMTPEQVRDLAAFLMIK